MALAAPKDEALVPEKSEDEDKHDVFDALKDEVFRGVQAWRARRPQR